MLVVTRKKDQTVVILNDDIEITVLEVKNGQVKLGIKAPENMKILRKEIIDQTKSVNEEAIVDTNTVDLDLLNKRL